jgi:hypothetical protein
MKKIILIVVFGVMCSYSYAQIAWGIRAGLNVLEPDDGYGSVYGLPAFEIGPTAYFSLKKNLYLNSGLMFSVKGFEGYNNYYYDLTGYFIELPVSAGYAFHIGRFALYAQAGPYIGIKVSEKFNDYSDYNGIEDIEEDLLKRFNYGLGAAAGINIYKFKIELGYQYGLANMSNIGSTLTLSSVFAGISYIF